MAEHYDDYPEYDDRVECWQCGGSGRLEDCFEDVCVCVDPPCCWQRCDICEGKGGWSNSDDSVTPATASDETNVPTVCAETGVTRTVENGDTA